MSRRRRKLIKELTDLEIVLVKESIFSKHNRDVDEELRHMERAQKAMDDYRKEITFPAARTVVVTQK